MAKKRYKKRQHSPTVTAKRLAEQKKLDGERERAKNRWDPTGRMLLYFDLVFLAAASILYMNHLISEVVSGLCTIIGLILLFAALWLLFGRKQRGSGRGPGL